MLRNHDSTQHCRWRYQRLAAPFEHKQKVYLFSSLFSYSKFCHHHSFSHGPSLYPEYSARAQSVIPSMTTSQAEHRRCHSLSGWFLFPVWRNTEEERIEQVFLQAKFWSVFSWSLVVVAFVYIFQSLQISGCFPGWNNNKIYSFLYLCFNKVISLKLKCSNPGHFKDIFNFK